MPTLQYSRRLSARTQCVCVGKIMVPIFRGRCSNMKYLGVEKRSHNLCGQSMYNMAISSYNPVGQLSYFLYQYILGNTLLLSRVIYCGHCLSVYCVLQQQHRLDTLSITYHLFCEVFILYCITDGHCSSTDNVLDSIQQVYTFIISRVEFKKFYLKPNVEAMEEQLPLS